MSSSSVESRKSKEERGNRVRLTSLWKCYSDVQVQDKQLSNVRMGKRFHYHLALIYVTLLHVKEFKTLNEK